MYREPAPVASSDPHHVAALKELFNQVNAALSQATASPSNPTHSHAALSHLKNAELAVQRARSQLRKHMAPGL